MTPGGVDADELPGLIAAVLAVARHRIGGIVLTGPASPARDHWLDMLRQLMGAESVWKTVPINVTEDRLLGGLDLAATLSAGQLKTATGLLVEANEGVLRLAMAERQASTVTGAVCAALDDHEVRVARDGVIQQSDSRFVVVAEDESLGEDEAIDPRLRERLGLTWTLHISGNDGYLAPFDERDCQRARSHFDRVDVPATVMEKLTAVADAIGLMSPRPVLQALAASRALAALHDREQVNDDDVSTAALLVLAMRVPGMLERLQTPEPEQAPAQPPPPPPEAETADSSNDAESLRRDSQAAELAESVAESAAAVLPPELLAMLARSAARMRSKQQAGRAGATRPTATRGRPLTSMPGAPVGGKRLDILATLKAAAPLQRIRTSGRPEATNRLAVRSDDLRIRRFAEKSRTTTIFVVDASGSAAAQRLAETKGAIELLLQECYVRRDEVALVAFRKQSAELILSPTRSLVRAKRTLAALPGGGGTPLAAGLQMALKEAEAVRKKGTHPQVVLLSDARANIDLAGAPGRETANEHALAIAHQISAADIPVLSIDTGRRPGARSQALADALDAQYLPLPFADAASVSAAVMGAL
ncbi:MAG: magnesium chelatase subunit D [Pseudomonadota bacterium]